jgi:hypothetical protein
MKDYLKDLIDHTYGLESIELIKITGTDKETNINAVAENRSVIISGSFKNPISDFIGVFGMPNLNKLKTIIGFDEYDEHAKISVTQTQRDGDTFPSALHFETKNGDFVNDYRFMGKLLIEEKCRTVHFKGVTWNVEFEPTIAGILRFKKQASANSEEQTFVIKTDNNDLRIYFGDPSTHSGNFVFQNNISGTISKPSMWPVKQFQAIMDLTGDKKVRISDSGVIEITVDSGLATYTYLIPAQLK